MSSPSEAGREERPEEVEGLTESQGHSFEVEDGMDGHSAGGDAEMEARDDVPGKDSVCESETGDETARKEEAQVLQAPENQEAPNQNAEQECQQAPAEMPVPTPQIQIRTLVIAPRLCEGEEAYVFFGPPVGDWETEGMVILEKETAEQNQGSGMETFSWRISSPVSEVHDKAVPYKYVKVRKEGEEKIYESLGTAISNRVLRFENADRTREHEILDPPIVWSDTDTKAEEGPVQLLCRLFGLPDEAAGRDAGVRLALHGCAVMSLAQRSSSRLVQSEEKLLTISAESKFLDGFIAFLRNRRESEQNSAFPSQDLRNCKVMLSGIAQKIILEIEQRAVFRAAVSFPYSPGCTPSSPDSPVGCLLGRLYGLLLLGERKIFSSLNVESLLTLSRSLCPFAAVRQKGLLGEGGEKEKEGAAVLFLETLQAELGERFAFMQRQELKKMVETLILKVHTTSNQPGISVTLSQFTLRRLLLRTTSEEGEDLKACQRVVQASVQSSRGVRGWEGAGGSYGKAGDFLGWLGVTGVWTGEDVRRFCCGVGSAGASVDWTGVVETVRGDSVSLRSVVAYLLYCRLAFPHLWEGDAGARLHAGLCVGLQSAGPAAAISAVCVAMQLKNKDEVPAGSFPELLTTCLRVLDGSVSAALYNREGERGAEAVAEGLQVVSDCVAGLLQKEFSGLWKRACDVPKPVLPGLSSTAAVASCRQALETALSLCRCVVAAVEMLRGCGYAGGRAADSLAERVVAELKSTLGKRKGGDEGGLASMSMLRISVNRDKAFRYTTLCATLVPLQSDGGKEAADLTRIRSAVGQRFAGELRALQNEEARVHVFEHVLSEREKGDVFASEGAKDIVEAAEQVTMETLDSALSTAGDTGNENILQKLLGGSLLQRLAGVLSTVIEKGWPREVASAVLRGTTEGLSDVVLKHVLWWRPLGVLFRFLLNDQSEKGLSSLRQKAQQILRTARDVVNSAAEQVVNRGVTPKLLRVLKDGFAQESLEKLWRLANPTNVSVGVTSSLSEAFVSCFEGIEFLADLTETLKGLHDVATLALKGGGGLKQNGDGLRDRLGQLREGLRCLSAVLSADRDDLPLRALVSVGDDGRMASKFFHVEADRVEGLREALQGVRESRLVGGIFQQCVREVGAGVLGESQNGLDGVSGLVDSFVDCVWPVVKIRAHKVVEDFRAGTMTVGMCRQVFKLCCEEEGRHGGIAKVVDAVEEASRAVQLGLRPLGESLCKQRRRQLEAFAVLSPPFLEDVRRVLRLREVFGLSASFDSLEHILTGGEGGKALFPSDRLPLNTMRVSTLQAVENIRNVRDASVVWGRHGQSGSGEGRPGFLRGVGVSQLSGMMALVEQLTSHRPSGEFCRFVRDLFGTPDEAKSLVFLAQGAGDSDMELDRVMFLDRVVSSLAPLIFLSSDSTWDGVGQALMRVAEGSAKAGDRQTLLKDLRELSRDEEKLWIKHLRDTFGMDDGLTLKALGEIQEGGVFTLRAAQSIATLSDKDGSCCSSMGGGTSALAAAVSFSVVEASSCAPSLAVPVFPSYADTTAIARALGSQLQQQGGGRSGSGQALRSVCEVMGAIRVRGEGDIEDLHNRLMLAASVKQNELCCRTYRACVEALFSLRGPLEALSRSACPLSNSLLLSVPFPKIKQPPEEEEEEQTGATKTGRDGPSCVAVLCYGWGGELEVCLSAPPSLGRANQRDTQTADDFSDERENPPAAVGTETALRGLRAWLRSVHDEWEQCVEELRTRFPVFNALTNRQLVFLSAKLPSFLRGGTREQLVPEETHQVCQLLHVATAACGGAGQGGRGDARDTGMVARELARLHGYVTSDVDMLGGGVEVRGIGLHGGSQLAPIDVDASPFRPVCVEIEDSERGDGDSDVVMVDVSEVQIQSSAQSPRGGLTESQLESLKRSWGLFLKRMRAETDSLPPPPKGQKPDGESALMSLASLGAFLHLLQQQNQSETSASPSPSAEAALFHSGGFASSSPVSSAASPPPLPPYIRRNNLVSLVLCPRDAVYAAVLGLWADLPGESRRLPRGDEVFVCSGHTTREELSVFVRHAFEGRGALFVLVGVERLSFEAAKHCSDAIGTLTESLDHSSRLHPPLVIICPVEDSDCSLLSSRFNDCLVHTPHSSNSSSSSDSGQHGNLGVAGGSRGVTFVEARQEQLREFLAEKLRFSPSVRDSSQLASPPIVDEEGHFSVRVVTSAAAGMGKSLLVLRRAEVLAETLQVPFRNVYVKVPLHGRAVDEESVVDKLIRQDIAHTRQGNSRTPRVLHLVVGSECTVGVERLLFQLVVLGCVRDSAGRVWTFRNGDSLFVECTADPIARKVHEPSVGACARVSERRLSGLAAGGQVVNLFPRVVCRSPREVLEDLRGGRSLSSSSLDLGFDGETLKNRAQLPCQYLSRYEAGENLDYYSFEPEQSWTSEAELTAYECLTVLTNNCSLCDPTWRDLSNFLSFLYEQLSRCEGNVFCHVPEDLPGFKQFVVRHLIQMSRDFTIASLTVNDDALGPSLRRKAEGREEDDEDEEMVAAGQPRQSRPPLLQEMRRNWESSPHPYLFFNSDGTSFSFLGMTVSKAGHLKDQHGNVVEDRIMTPELRRALDDQCIQGVINPFSESCRFNALDKAQKIEFLGRVMGLDYPHDPDERFELTEDNAQKMMAVEMRRRCGIPAVTMGETGCGKTALLTYRSALKMPPGVSSLGDREAPPNLITLRIHGGTKVDDVRLVVEIAEQRAEENWREWQIEETTVFFDEVNASDEAVVGLVKEILCDGTVDGRPIRGGVCEWQYRDGGRSAACGGGNRIPGSLLFFVAACNPYRRHSEGMIRRLEEAGLGFNKPQAETERLGDTPLRHLVYRVCALPPSLASLVWDFGSLSEEAERKYVEKMAFSRLKGVEGGSSSRAASTLVATTLTCCQAFMRARPDECAFVSLRNVERALSGIRWFSGKLGLLDESVGEERGGTAPDGLATRGHAVTPVATAAAAAVGGRSAAATPRKVPSSSFSTSMTRLHDVDVEEGRKGSEASDDVEMVEEESVDEMEEERFVGGGLSRQSLRGSVASSSSGLLSEGFLRSLLLSVGAFYCTSLADAESRERFSAEVAKALRSCGCAQVEDSAVVDELERAQHAMFAETRDGLEGKDIAANAALLENLFMMVVCADMRIPLFVIGRPGSSKSLAKALLSQAMKGPALSVSPLFRSLKEAKLVSYQCSPLSTAEGIIGVFDRAAKLQKGKDLENVVGIAVLDEVALAEECPQKPLKPLHGLLDDGVASGGAGRGGQSEVWRKVATIAISNWAVDPAKTNRGALLVRPVPSKKDLVATARKIARAGGEVFPNMFKVLERDLKGATEAFDELCRLQHRECYGLRDFWALIKMMKEIARRRMGELTRTDVAYAVRRNFGGGLLEAETDPLTIFGKHMKCRAELEDNDWAELREPAVVRLMRDNLRGSHSPHIPWSSSSVLGEGGEDTTASGDAPEDCRYLLVITENYSALDILKESVLAAWGGNGSGASPSGLLSSSSSSSAAGGGGGGEIDFKEKEGKLSSLSQPPESSSEVVILFGSSFPGDLEYSTVCRMVNRVKDCMETGKTLVLLNLETLYESLYDALNQYFTTFAGQRYVDLGLGSQRVKCRVHRSFRLLVVAEASRVAAYPIPLLGRLEKHRLTVRDLLARPALAQTLQIASQWARDFSKLSIRHRDVQMRMRPSVANSIEPTRAFASYSEDTLAAIVLAEARDLEESEGDDFKSTEGLSFEEKLFLAVKRRLLDTALPDAVLRLPFSCLAFQPEKEDVGSLQASYFDDPSHGSLAGVIWRLLNERKERERSQTPFLCSSSKSVDFSLITTRSRLVVQEDLESAFTSALSLSSPSGERLARSECTGRIVEVSQFSEETQFRQHLTKQALPSLLEQNENQNSNSKDRDAFLLVQCDAAGRGASHLFACVQTVLEETTREALDQKENLKREGGTCHLHVLLIARLSPPVLEEDGESEVSGESSTSTCGLMTAIGRGGVWRRAIHVDFLTPDSSPQMLPPLTQLRTLSMAETWQAADLSQQRSLLRSCAHEACTRMAPGAPSASAQRGAAGRLRLEILLEITEEEEGEGERARQGLGAIGRIDWQSRLLRLLCQAVGTRLIRREENVTLATGRRSQWVSLAALSSLQGVGGRFSSFSSSGVHLQLQRAERCFSEAMLQAVRTEMAPQLRDVVEVLDRQANMRLAGRGMMHFELGAQREIAKGLPRWSTEVWFRLAAVELQDWRQGGGEAEAVQLVSSVPVSFVHFPFAWRVAEVLDTLTAEAGGSGGLPLQRRALLLGQSPLGSLLSRVLLSPEDLEEGCKILGRDLVLLRVSEISGVPNETEVLEAAVAEVFEGADRRLTGGGEEMQSMTDRLESPPFVENFCARLVAAYEELVVGRVAQGLRHAAILLKAAHAVLPSFLLVQEDEAGARGEGREISQRVPGSFGLLVATCIVRRLQSTFEGERSLKSLTEVAEWVVSLENPVGALLAHLGGEKGSTSFRVRALSAGWESVRVCALLALRAAPEMGACLFRNFPEERGGLRRTRLERQKQCAKIEEAVAAGMRRLIHELPTKVQNSEAAAAATVASPDDVALLRPFSLSVSVVEGVEGVLNDATHSIEEAAFQGGHDAALPAACDRCGAMTRAFVKLQRCSHSVCLDCLQGEEAESAPRNVCGVGGCGERLSPLQREEVKRGLERRQKVVAAWRAVATDFFTDFLSTFIFTHEGPSGDDAEALRARNATREEVEARRHQRLHALLRHLLRHVGRQEGGAARGADVHAEVFCALESSPVVRSFLLQLVLRHGPQQDSDLIPLLGFCLQSAEAHIGSEGGGENCSRERGGQSLRPPVALRRLFVECLEGRIEESVQQSSIFSSHSGFSEGAHLDEVSLLKVAKVREALDRLQRGEAQGGGGGSSAEREASGLLNTALVRFCLGVTAELLCDRFPEGPHSADGGAGVLSEAEKKLLEGVRAVVSGRRLLLGVSPGWALVFLMRLLCRQKSVVWWRQLSAHPSLKWIAPQWADAQSGQGGGDEADLFLLEGEPQDPKAERTKTIGQKYGTIRDALSEALMRGQASVLTDALTASDGLQGTEGNAAAGLLRAPASTQLHEQEKRFTLGLAACWNAVRTLRSLQEGAADGQERRPHAQGEGRGRREVWQSVEALLSGGMEGSQGGVGGMHLASAAGSGNMDDVEKGGAGAFDAQVPSSSSSRRQRRRESAFHGRDGESEETFTPVLPGRLSPLSHLIEFSERQNTVRVHERRQAMGPVLHLGCLLATLPDDREGTRGSGGGGRGRSQVLLHLASTLRRLFENPGTARQLFLPGMEADVSGVALDRGVVSGSTQVCACPNTKCGEPYHVGDCGQLNGTGKCSHCGGPIGRGTRSQVYQRAARHDSKGHTCGGGVAAQGEVASGSAQRALPASVCLRRLVTHCVLAAAAARHWQGAASAVNPLPGTTPLRAPLQSEGETVGFFLDHVNADAQRIATSLRLPPDGAFVLLHSVIGEWASCVLGGRLGCRSDSGLREGDANLNGNRVGLETETGREAWDRVFMDAIGGRALGGAQGRVEGSRKVLLADGRLTGNVILRVVLEQSDPPFSSSSSGASSSSRGRQYEAEEGDGTLWRYRQATGVETAAAEVETAADRWKSSQEQSRGGGARGRGRNGSSHRVIHLDGDPSQSAAEGGRRNGFHLAPLQLAFANMHSFRLLGLMPSVLRLVRFVNAAAERSGARRDESMVEWMDIDSEGSVEREHRRSAAAAAASVRLSVREAASTRLSALLGDAGAPFSSAESALEAHRLVRDVGAALSLACWGSPLRPGGLRSHRLFSSGALLKEGAVDVALAALRGHGERDGAGDLDPFVGFLMPRRKGQGAVVLWLLDYMAAVHNSFVDAYSAVAAPAGLSSVPGAAGRGQGRASGSSAGGQWERGSCLGVLSSGKGPGGGRQEGHGEGHCLALLVAKCREHSVKVASGSGGTASSSSTSGGRLSGVSLFSESAFDLLSLQRAVHEGPLKNGKTPSLDRRALVEASRGIACSSSSLSTPVVSSSSAGLPPSVSLFYEFKEDAHGPAAATAIEGALEKAARAVPQRALPWCLVSALRRVCGLKRGVPAQELLQTLQTTLRLLPALGGDPKESLVCALRRLQLLRQPPRAANTESGQVRSGMRSSSSQTARQDDKRESGRRQLGRGQVESEGGASSCESALEALESALSRSLVGRHKDGPPTAPVSLCLGHAGALASLLDFVLFCGASDGGVVRGATAAAAAGSDTVSGGRQSSLRVSVDVLPETLGEPLKGGAEGRLRERLMRESEAVRLTVAFSLHEVIRRRLWTAAEETESVPAVVAGRVQQVDGGEVQVEAEGEAERDPSLAGEVSAWLDVRGGQEGLFLSPVVEEVRARPGEMEVQRVLAAGAVAGISGPDPLVSVPGLGDETLSSDSRVIKFWESLQDDREILVKHAAGALNVIVSLL
uniref:CBM20 domain-containing protein n=1 Tax=Chromera velia CCMP2878 TaxID=1169474 RepID=A0A0G4FFV2_9ALVE|eukprot:Cvel_16717.t1-p1 / transcript=Cvel_16717.t1 / gene=Cvel_16717 / organism=Chromera_velia_CCMP2878 / gene_product=E3 ubiquitin-protein ligase RNF213, putative / transcript_product=E3 ubiquitin-protein ligase RNF213, putative / location=Cvel_scaffold1299:17235-45649(+) / protein_length=6443 / sequence_SO=supercontig / SO=protein_coding / is_pseudo=false